MKQVVKAGHLVYVSGTAQDGTPTRNLARVIRWNTKLMGSRSAVPGFMPVVWASGGTTLIHISRVIESC